MSQLSKHQDRAVADPAWASFWAPLLLSLVVATPTWIPEWIFNRQPPIPGYVGFLVNLITFAIGILWQNCAESAVLRRTIETRLSAKDTELSAKDSAIRSLSADAADLRARLQSAILHRDVKLQISIANFNNFLPYIPLYVASGCEFFEEEGLKVEILPHNDDLDAINSVATRKNHFAISDPMFVFDPSVEHAALRIVAPFINKVAVWALSKIDLQAVLADGAPRVRRRLRVITFDEETTAYRLATNLGERLKKKGFIIESTDVVALTRGPQEEMTAFFKRNFIDNRQGLEKADILIFSEPETTYLKKKLESFKHHESLHDLLYPGEQFAFTSVIALERTLALEPEVVRRFLRAIRHAQLFVYSLPPLPDAGVAAFLRSDEGWRRTAQAVQNKIMTCYPSGMVMGLPDVARLIEDLRRKSYFSSSLTYREKWRDGLVHAYQLAKGANTDDLDSRTIDVADQLKLVSF